MNYYHNEIIQSIIDFIIIIGILVGIGLGIQISYIYFGISILFIGIILYLHKLKKVRLGIFHKEIIEGQWGKEHEVYKDFSQIEKLYKFLLEKEGDRFKIDDITWKDLNMDSVFSKIDHTKSLPGKQYLYNILRTPIFDENKLKKRNHIINRLLEDKNLSLEIQYLLSILGKEKGKSIFRFFIEGIKIDTRPAILYKLLSYLPYLTIVTMFFNPSIAFIIIIMTTMINTAFYQLSKKKIYDEMDIFLYLGSLIRCADSILKLPAQNIDLNQDEIRDILKKIGVIRKNINKINYNETFYSDSEIMIHYYNMIFLKEPNVFYKTVKLINNYEEEFYKLYNLIGKTDAYISIASYKDSLKYYTEPNFIEGLSNFYLKAKDLYHPLLDNPVSYNFELDNEGALVTGSNASGKSTFLRTIGINVIFSETLYIVLAREYNSSCFKLLTSIGTTDSIVEGDSYFMAEAKSLKRILDILNPNQPILCILDEIFRGTNTAERISAAKESLNYMINRNCCVVAATHDLELTNLVNESYNNYHFREIIEENDIKFDYILRNGPCTTRNAIAILQYLGYPKEIQEKALIEAKKFSNNN